MPFFSVGQKVVCIDDVFDPGLAKYYVALPKRNLVYVVRGVVPGVLPDGSGGITSVYLVGLTNPRSEKAPHPERGFDPRRFRPLDEVQATNRAKAKQIEGAPMTLPAS